MLKQLTAAAFAVASLMMPAGVLSVLAQATIEPEVTSPAELPAVTQEQVVAACAARNATEAGCRALLAAYFQHLGQTGIVGVDLEAAIATLVVALAEAAVPAEAKWVVVAAIEDIGRHYATGEQAAAILQIAQSVQAGATIQTGAVDISGA
jgi:hypothetical protein